MGNLKFFENLVDKKLLGLHTAYLAKVLSVNGGTAKIQPLGLTKVYGDSAKAQSPLTDVPIIQSARYKITYNAETPEISSLTPLSAGDVVLCVCCERNITEAKKGKNALPPVGHHQQSDSLIVGIL